MNPQVDCIFTFYNEQRPHQAHAYRTPAEIHQQKS
ncbi:MAG: integrase core domain-containing protein [Nitrospira sp.]|nr:integrase core domain-containing protein [Nitrospira sp.]